MSWLHQALQDGVIGGDRWQETGLPVSKDHAYDCYKEFSKQRREWQPEIKDAWSKNIHAVLGPNVKDTRPTNGNERVRSFQFAPLADCRRQFASHLGAPDLEWEPENEPGSAPSAVGVQAAEDVGEPTKLDAPLDAATIELEPELEPERD